jgi:hypothetical protein
VAVKENFYAELTLPRLWFLVNKSTRILDKGSPLPYKKAMDVSLATAQTVPPVVAAVHIFSQPLLDWFDWEGEAFCMHTLGVSYIDLPCFARHFPMPKRTRVGFGAQLFRPLFEFMDGNPDNYLNTFITASDYWAAFEVTDAPQLIAIVHTVVVRNQLPELSQAQLFEALDRNMVRFALSLGCSNVSLENTPPVLFTEGQIHRIISQSARAMLS